VANKILKLSEKYWITGKLKLLLSEKYEKRIYSGSCSKILYSSCLMYTKLQWANEASRATAQTPGGFSTGLLEEELGGSTNTEGPSQRRLHELKGCDSEQLEGPQKSSSPSQIWRQLDSGVVYALHEFGFANTNLRTCFVSTGRTATAQAFL